MENQTHSNKIIPIQRAEEIKDLPKTQKIVALVPEWSVFRPSGEPTHNFGKKR